ncbi:MAG: dienelactone hydrolase family protein [Gammaproteobacteria bacterium]|nr:dienelactone hydrolase family protein [Gammaproteobacteria bacterium]
MKKALTVLGFVVAICMGPLGGYWAQEWAKEKADWRQHHPITEITVNGVERKYHLFVPTSSQERPMSLVVMLMGGDAGSWKFPQQGKWEELAETEGMVIAFPVGKLFPPNESAWQLNTHSQARHDIDFMAAMIDDISASHAIDSRRVFAVGYSLGSMFSYELACQMSERFAAIASFAGTMPVSPKSCDPQRNVPLMHIHGVKDPIISYEHAWDWKDWDSVGTMRDIPSLVQFWRDRYNCQEERRVVSESRVHLVYDSCEQGARVEHYRLETVGHEWPETLRGVSTHEVIWSFFSDFTTRQRVDDG